MTCQYVARLLIAAAFLCCWEVGHTSPGFGCDAVGCCCREADAVIVSRRGEWLLADSPNFQVCSIVNEAEAERVARHCECLRTHLEATWHGTKERWAVRCQVVLHESLASYRRAVGAGGAMTLGSSLATPVRGPIQVRRIDLRTDVPDVLTAALPHELCHLVIADRFREGPAPLWFDEGAALQYDPANKRRLHERDFQVGLTRGEAFPLEELLAETRYPPAERWDVFYGQSGSLLRWILSRVSPERALEFAKRAKAVGANRGVAEVLRLGSADELYRTWRLQAVELDAPLPEKMLLPTAEPLRLVER